MTTTPARRLRVTYVSEAAAVEMPANPATAMLSITAPGSQAELADGWGALLCIQFSDAEYDNATIQNFRSKGKRFDPTAKGFPDRRCAERMREFLDGLVDRPDIEELVVHCHAGQRRSAAVARYAAERFGADFDMTYDGYNRTVYALMRDPKCFSEQQLDPRVGSRTRGSAYLLGTGLLICAAAVLAWCSNR